MMSTRPNARSAGTVALFVALLLAGAIAGAQQKPAPDPARFKTDIQAFEQWDAKNAVPTDSVLFVGSSTIRMWPTADRFPGLPVVNRGFGGSQIPDVNHYLDQLVLKHRPAVVVFYAGDNDLNDGRSVDQVVEDFRTFVLRVLAARADTRIVFLAIKPSPARWTSWPVMRTANERIQSYIAGHSSGRPVSPTLFYADVATPMLTADGRTQPHLYIADGLHLSDAGYDLWTRIVAPIVERARTPR